MTNTASSFRFIDPQKTSGSEAAAKNGSVIGVGLVLTGSIAAVGDVLVGGTVDGNVRSEARVVIAAGGVVTGKLDVREAAAQLPEEITPDITDDAADCSDETEPSDDEAAE